VSPRVTGVTDRPPPSLTLATLRLPAEMDQYGCDPTLIVRAQPVDRGAARLVLGGWPLLLEVERVDRDL
jgi:hypothetical protein